MTNGPKLEITRRDFFNGMMLAAGGTAVSSFFPMRAFADNAFPPDGPIGVDPRVTRGGNLRSVFNVGHWLRDNRLTFHDRYVELAPGRADRQQGRFDLEEDGGHYDVIIVGGGYSGFSAAFFLSQSRPGTRILILDGNATPGGNANRDDAPPIPDISSTATAYAVSPYSDQLNQIYDTCNVHWADHLITSPVYSYFFDDKTPFVRPGTRGWNIDTYGAGMASVPYPDAILRDLLASRDDIIATSGLPGAPTDPADNSDPSFDYLAVMSHAQYLAGKGYHPAIADFYTRYHVDALAGTSEQVSAYAAIDFLGAEFLPAFAYPGGNSGVLRHFLKHLVPNAIRGTTETEIIRNPIDRDELDRPSNRVRVRTGALAVRADNVAGGATVVYHRGDDFYRARAKAVIWAGQSHTARTACAHLFSQGQLDAADSVALCPVVVANVTLRKAGPVADLGYDAYWWGSKYWADFVVSDWGGPNRHDPNRRTVLTFYGGNDLPVAQMPQARIDLLTTPFSSYERSLRDNLGRILAGRGFDFERDVEAIYLYRWGHSMVISYPGWCHGPPVTQGGQIIRTPSPRVLARQQVGRVSFGAQDVESTPSGESAIGAGFRTASEVLPLL